MTTLYNDNDPHCAAWLRELIAQHHLPDGEVLTDPIQTLTHAHLTPTTTFHTFAGIGGWPLALQLAGWPSERSVWTGSCPCQPFSCAGARKGNADERHLWPAWFALIRQYHPDTIFGEQVPGAIGHGWLDGVCADLEGEGYAVGAIVLGAHSVGAPHIRQRLYWVALSRHERQSRELCESGSSFTAHNKEPRAASGGPSNIGGVAHHLSARLEERPSIASDTRSQCASVERGDDVGGPWRNTTPHKCLDNKTRRIPLEPAFFPLADGLQPACVVKLRGAGNAIVPQVAALFIRAFLSLTP